MHPKLTTVKTQPISFPFDEGKHKDAETEWWYYTGWLQEDEGKNYTYELCFFRSKAGSPIDMSYFAHFALSDVVNKKQREAERAFFPAWGKAKVAKCRLDLSYGNWGATGNNKSYHIWAKDKDMAIDLHMKSIRTPILGVGMGAIDMGDRGISYYYSIPRLKTNGKLTFEGKKYTVSGISWMDHQWGNWEWYEPFGWNWWGLNLDNGLDLIIYGFPDNSVTAIVKYPDESQARTNKVTFKRLKWWKSPTTHIEYPIEWSIKIPDLEAKLFIKTTFPDQEMTTRIKYWEGGCLVYGKIKGQDIKGRGYMELVGYKWTDLLFLKWMAQTMLAGLFNVF